MKSVLTIPLCMNLCSFNITKHVGTCNPITYLFISMTF